MTRIIVEPILQILILTPIIILFLKDKNKTNFQRILIFIFCYLVYQIIIVLPKIIPLFDFIKSSWNWDGKILGIIWGIISYFLFKNYFKDNDFFTLKQNKKD